MKQRYPVSNLLIVCLPLLGVGLFWNRVPLHLPLHFTRQGQPDHFGTRAQWVGMLVSTTLLLTAVIRVMISVLLHRLVLHPLRIGAVYLLSAFFIASLISLLVLKTLFIAPECSGFVPILLTLYGSGLLHFGLPSFLPQPAEKVNRQPSPTRPVVLQKIYRLSRSVLVRVNAVIAVVMLPARPDDRWIILFAANLSALLVLSVWISLLYRKALETP